MVKAQITTKSGSKIVFEGTPKEVALLVSQLEEKVLPPKEKRSSSNKPKTKHRPTPTNLIDDLIDGGFFNKPKELSAIKMALEEQGHFYPVTTLSPTVLRFVRKRDLRRIKENKRWLYVN